MTLRELISTRSLRIESYEEWLDRLRRETREHFRADNVAEEAMADAIAQANRESERQRAEQQQAHRMDDYYRVEDCE